MSKQMTYDAQYTSYNNYMMCSNDVADKISEGYRIWREQGYLTNFPTTLCEVQKLQQLFYYNTNAETTTPGDHIFSEVTEYCNVTFSGKNEFKSFDLVEGEYRSGFDEKWTTYNVNQHGVKERMESCKKRIQDQKQRLDGLMQQCDAMLKEADEIKLNVEKQELPQFDERLAELFQIREKEQCYPSGFKERDPSGKIITGKDMQQIFEEFEKSLKNTK